MNQVQTFGFGLLDIRVIQQDGEPWFAAKDVCLAIGRAWCGSSLAPLKTDEKGLSFAVTPGGAQNIAVISESGLYKLIMRSDKPEARTFQDWVKRVVLLAIRKDGAYVMGEEKVAAGELSEDELVMRAMSIMSRKVERLALERDQLALDKQALALTNDHLARVSSAQEAHEQTPTLKP